MHPTYSWCATIPKGFNEQRDFAMLDDIKIANKENPLSKSSNMAAMT